jgi:hypothetical protein
MLVVTVDVRLEVGLEVSVLLTEVVAVLVADVV